MNSDRVGGGMCVNGTLLAALAALGFLLGGCEQSPPASHTASTEGRDAAPVAEVGQTEPEIEAAAVAAPVEFSVEREKETDLRLVSYNVLWNTIFPEVDAEGAARFRRLMQALDPEVVALQEIGLRPGGRGGAGARNWTADDVVTLMNDILPLGEGKTWYGQQGGDNVTVARYPLSLQRSESDPPGDRSQSIALVDLPDERYALDLYVLNNHYKCCGGNDDRRQEQSDAIIAWLRDARTAGGKVDLPANTAIVVCGDLNIVDGFGPVETLLTGDIQDENVYGADFAPDWDDTTLVDLHPKHNATLEQDYTWRNDRGQYAPGRLDYIIYTDSVLDVARHFVLNTALLTPESLDESGLQMYDVTADGVGARYDHLPLVADFRAE